MIVGRVEEGVLYVAEHLRQNYRVAEGPFYCAKHEQAMA